MSGHLRMIALLMMMPAIMTACGTAPAATNSTDAQKAPDHPANAIFAPAVIEPASEEITRSNQSASVFVGMTVGDTTTLHLRADVDETDIGRVAIGDRASVTFPGFPHKTFSARIVHLAQKLGPRQVALQNPTTRRDVDVLEAILRLDRSSTRLPIGLRGDVKIEPATGRLKE